MTCQFISATDKQLRISTNNYSIEAVARTFLSGHSLNAPISYGVRPRELSKRRGAATRAFCGSIFPVERDLHNFIRTHFSG